MEASKAIQRFTWGVFLVMATVSACSTLQGLFLDDIIGFYSLKAAMQGMLGSMQGMGGMLVIVLNFVMMGRVSKPIILTALLVMIAISMLGISLRPPFVTLMLLYMLFGVAKGLADTTTSSAIADLHSGKRMAANIGVLHAMFGISGMLTPFAVMLLTNTGMSWDAVYGAFAIITLAFMAVYVWTYYTSREHVKPVFAQNPKLSPSGIKALFLEKRMWLLMGTVICYAIYQISYYLWINRFAVVYMNDASLGALALSIFWIGTALARLLVPRLKISPQMILFWGNLVALLFALVGIWSMSAPMLLVCSLLTALACGAGVSMFLYIGCAWHKDNTTLVTSVLYFVFYIGQMVSPLIVGELSDGYGMQVGLSIVFLFALLSSAFVIWLRKEKV